MGSKTLVQLTCYYMYETAKAFRAEFKDSEGEVLGEAWLPHSQVKQVVNGCGGFVVCGERGEELLVEMPRWLAESDGVEDLIREQMLEGEDKMDEDEDTPNDGWNYEPEEEE